MATAAISSDVPMDTTAIGRNERSCASSRLTPGGLDYRLQPVVSDRLKVGLRLKPPEGAEVMRRAALPLRHS